MYQDITNAELAAFLRTAASYFRNRETGGEDAAFWANEANAERCDIAASRLGEMRGAPLKSVQGDGNE